MGSLPRRGALSSYAIPGSDTLSRAVKSGTVLLKSGTATLQKKTPPSPVLRDSPAAPLPQRKVLADNTNRQNLNHSPIDSPPTIKKKLCRLSTGQHGALLDSLDARFVFETPAVDIAKIALGDCPQNLTYPAVDKKLVRTQSGPTISSPSILKKQLNKEMRSKSLTSSADKGCLPRNVSFADSVTVILIDDSGSYVGTESQKLRAAVQELLYDNSPITLSKLNSAIAPAASQRTSSTSSPPSSPSSTQGPAAVNFTFVEDPQTGLKLRFLVPLGLGFDPLDIVVKANMSGSRVRVVATNRNGESQYNERYQLPMDVNPYQVTARLDAKGQLIVEAPLKTMASKTK